MEVHVTLDDNVRCPGSEWKDFAARHAQWVTDHTNDIGMVYSLPRRCFDKAIGLYDLSLAEVKAEADFAELCDHRNVIGFLDGQSICNSWLADFKDYVGETQNGCDQDVLWLQTKYRRMRAGLGRIISSPDFQADVESLGQNYFEIAEADRPPFPLVRPFGVDSITAITSNDRGPILDPCSDFWTKFIAFCDKWAVRGLTDWWLPQVEGPRWPDLLAPPDENGRERLTLSTP